MNVISSIVGSILLIASLTLAYLASANGEARIAKQNAIIKKYLEESEYALEDEDVEEAIQYAKLAMQADPKNKKAFEAYDKAMQLKYHTQKSENSSGTPSPNAAAEVEMGC